MGRWGLGCGDAVRLEQMFWMVGSCIIGRDGQILRIRSGLGQDSYPILQSYPILKSARIYPEVLFFKKAPGAAKERKKRGETKGKGNLARQGSLLAVGRRRFDRPPATGIRY